MGRSAVFSGLLHAAVILLTVLGLPWLYSDQEVLQATSVTTITDAQLAELQSKSPPAQKRQDQPKDETIPPAPDAPPVPEPEVEPEPEPEPEPEAEAEPSPEPAPPEPEPAPPAPVAVVPEPEPAPPAPEPAPPEPEPQPQAEIAPAPQEPVIAEPEPEPQPEEPVVPLEQQLAEAQPKPVPPKKPKKKETKKTEVAKKQPLEEKIKEKLANQDKKSKPDKKPKKEKPAEASASAAEADPGIPQRLPFGEEDAIRRQIQPNWNYNPGLPGIEKMTVDLIIIMNPDGSVQRVDFADPGAVNSSPDYRAFCESAKRAVRLSSPLKMPPNRPYDLWKRIIMGFRVEDL